MNFSNDIRPIFSQISAVCYPITLLNGMFLQSGIPVFSAISLLCLDSAVALIRGRRERIMSVLICAWVKVFRINPEFP